MLDLGKVSTRNLGTSMFILVVNHSSSVNLLKVDTQILKSCIILNKIVRERRESCVTFRSVSMEPVLLGKRSSNLEYVNDEFLRRYACTQVPTHKKQVLWFISGKWISQEPINQLNYQGHSQLAHKSHTFITLEFAACRQLGDMIGLRN